MDPLNGTVQRRFWNGWSPKRWSEVVSKKRNNRPVYLLPTNFVDRYHKGKKKPTRRANILSGIKDHVKSNIQKNKQFAKDVAPFIFKGNLTGVVDTMVDRVFNDLHINAPQSVKNKVTDTILWGDIDKGKESMRRLRDLDRDHVAAAIESYFNRKVRLIPNKQ